MERQQSQERVPLLFRLRFIAGLLSLRLSNCSLDFPQPLVFIALSSRTLTSFKSASSSVEILLLDVRVSIYAIIDIRFLISPLIEINSRTI